MAAPNQDNADPLHELIADGRLRTVPFAVDIDVTVLTINFDNFATILRSVLRSVYTDWLPIRNQYTGNNASITANINADIDDMITFALWCCYNRLRAVAERYSPTTRTALMNTRAACSPRLEFPAFLSQLLQTVGPLRVHDGPHSVLALYAPPAGTHQNFGRGAPQAPLATRHARITEALRAAHVTLAPIDQTPNFGSFWTTCGFNEDTDELTNVVGFCHPSHYVNEDVAYALTLLGNQDTYVFTYPGFTVGYTEDEAVTNALAAAEVQGMTAAQANAVRSVGMVYDVNYRGVRPAVAQTAATAARAARAYIVGLGNSPIYSCYLARHLTNYDVNTVWMHRFRR